VRPLGTIEEPNRPTIKTGIGGSALSGRWRVELVAGGRLVRRLNVQIGR
jgi:hypothetical protein